VRLSEVRDLRRLRECHFACHALAKSENFCSSRAVETHAASCPLLLAMAIGRVGDAARAVSRGRTLVRANLAHIRRA
jgi:hypothetical protein